MINRFPNEIIFEILKYTDIKTFSSLLSSNIQNYNLLNPLKWEIIDSMINTGHPVPLNLETYNNFIFTIDWITIIYNKINIPESTIELFMINRSESESESINIHKFDINILLKYQKLSEQFLCKYYHLCDWKVLIIDQKLPIQILEKIISHHYSEMFPMHWYNILYHQKYSLENFIQKYGTEVINWYAVSCNKDAVTPDILVKYYDYLVWPELTKHGLNEEIIEMFIHKLDPISWSNIAFYSKLSSNFILKYRNSLNSQIILRCQTLNSETLLELLSTQEGYEKEESWINISLYQSLDYHFIKTHKDNLSIKYLIRNPRIKRKDLFVLYPNHVL